MNSGRGRGGGGRWRRLGAGLAVAGVGAAAVGWMVLRPAAPSDGGAGTVEVRAGTVQVALRGSGPDLLVFHGTPGGFDQAVWLARPFRDAGYRIVAPSRPGYLGTTAAPASEGDLWAGVMDAVDADRAVVLAWSGGAASAVDLALRHPERVSALVLLAPALVAVELPTAGPSDRSLGLGRLLLRRMPGWAASRVTPDTAVARRLREDPSARARMDDLLATLISGGRRDGGRSRDRRRLADLRLELERLRVPTLVVHGSDDRTVPRKLLIPAVERIPGARRIEIAGAGHLLPLHPAYPARVPEILAFMKSHGSRSDAGDPTPSLEYRP